MDRAEPTGYSRVDEPIGAIVIPAHNEERVLKITLPNLAPLLGQGVEIVIVANGCVDGTASAARSLGFHCVDIPQASKTAALNAGDDAVSSYPRIYLDADVIVDARTILEVINRMRSSDVLAAAPRLKVVMAKSTRLVRLYYSGWLASDYFNVGHVGSGFYALSLEARRRFATFPDLISDDLYVQQLFKSSELTVYTDLVFSINAPRTFRSLSARAIRILAGNAQLKKLAAPTSYISTQPTRRVLHLLRRSRRLNRSYVPALFYLACSAIFRWKASRLIQSARKIDWSQDRTTR
jgi:glycosyltransferase involved in cell wall biosynthesis